MVTCLVLNPFCEGATDHTKLEVKRGREVSFKFQFKFCQVLGFLTGISLLGHLGIGDRNRAFHFVCVKCKIEN